MAQTVHVKDRDWIAVQVRSGTERFVGAGLQKRGYEEFVPLYRESGSRYEQRSYRPLFPGYVFCRFIQCWKHRIVEVAGVIRLVGTEHAPISIPENEIEAIRLAVSSGLYSEPWKFLQGGQQVIVNRGALRGVHGIFVSASNGGRLVISVGLLGRSIAVEVNASDVMPLSAPY